MKSVIIYYSFSGNTKKVVGILAEYLGSLGEVRTIELKARDESGNFFNQCLRAFRHRQAKIEPVPFDPGSFDLLCLGSPVWAFGPAPAINAYLEQCVGVKDKRVVLFTTFGSGTGNGRCLNYMQASLSQKGVKDFTRFSIQQFKVDDREFVLSKIKELHLPPADLLP
jgi:flavodoxin